MLGQTEYSFDTSGRRSVEYRMSKLYGDVVVIKAKSNIQVSIQAFIGQVLEPDELIIMFGDIIYDEWAGEENTIRDASQLVHCEYNKASAYLIFKGLSD